MTHSLNRRLSIGIVAMLAVAGSYSVVALASTTPSFAIAGGAVPETTTPFNAVLTKGAKASSYSKVTVTTVDGTAHAGVDYKPISTTLTIANTTLSVKIPVTIIPRPGYQGPRTFKVHIAAARYAVIAVPDATVTINETEAPPPAVTWTKCADENGTCSTNGNVRYGFGSTWTTPRSVSGSIACNNATWGDPLPGTFKECDTDTTAVSPPTPTPSPLPPPPIPQPNLAALQDGSFAHVKANDSLWDVTGPGNGRHLVPGESVVIFYQGWGYSAEGQVTFAIYALSDGSQGRAVASDLEPYYPTAIDRALLPANWWIPGIVTAVKNCVGATNPAYAGVTQGGVYRAEMVIGTHVQLADGVVGDAGSTWEVFALGDPSGTSHVIVRGDCLMGGDHH